MKLQLDTKSKTIKIEGSVNLEELYETLAKLLPKGEWKLFTLEANSIIEWINPIQITRYPYYQINPYPWWESPTYVSYNTQGSCVDSQGYTNKATYILNEGVYNIEI